MSLGRTIRALSDKNRRKVLTVLKRGDMPVGDILEHLSITGASLSHHLGILKEADLIGSRREGQQVIYSLNLSVFEETVKELTEFLERQPVSVPPSRSLTKQPPKT
ncbi:winged helix-turn-helix transcriptional regulator [Candidatus Uhrbacteria bacterium]|nr:winged helix-turn-helix transcriptional regulator [Candidatus Uhrbacteria bacterium]